MAALTSAAQTPLGAASSPTPSQGAQSVPPVSAPDPAQSQSGNLQQAAASLAPLTSTGQATAPALQSQSAGNAAGGTATDPGRVGGPRRQSAVASFKSATSAGAPRSMSSDASRELSPAPGKTSGGDAADQTPVHADAARLGSESAQPDLSASPSAASTETAAALGAASSVATATTTGTPSASDASAAQPGAQTAADLSAQMAQKLAGQNTRFDLQLNPDGLGRVDVAVQIDAKGALSAALSFEKPEAASLMHAHAGDLQQSLAQAGFHVSEAALSFSTSDQGRGQGQAQANAQSFLSGGGAQGGGDGQGRSAGRAFNAAALAAAQTDQFAASSQGLSGQGLAARGLDIKI
jgi:flagellar hook-length control protein FliK